MTAAVSFVVPAYNCAATIDEALRSIVEGDLLDGDEIIVVGYASSDQPREQLAAWQARHRFVRVLRNEVYKGCPASRNIGIRRAIHGLLFNLDSDDVLVP